MKKLLAACCLICLLTETKAQKILTERDRSTLVDSVLTDRLDNLLPLLMRQSGIDCWVIISREYNEDPVLKTMLPSTWLSARRRTIFFFYDNGTTVEKLAIARYDVGGLLKGEWDLSTNPDQWQALTALIKKKNPKKIGLNFSLTYAHADGLTFTEQGEFLKNLPVDFQNRVVSAENLAVAWLETRTEKEMAIYKDVCRLSHDIIKRAFSPEVITPGKTTPADVVWWMRQEITKLGFETWFQPTVDIQRNDVANFDHLKAFTKNPDNQIILPGDLLHCDFGISYLRLNSDQQQHAYILKADETEVPEYLQKAFKNANRLQDILTSHFNEGKSGNQILAESLAQAKSEKIDGTIYTHPIGLHGHAAGPTIGMWDNQGRTVGAGDYKMRPNTAYSIELNAAVQIPEWKKTIRIMLEEDGFYNGSSFYYIDGRQESIIGIK